MLASLLLLLLVSTFLALGGSSGPLALDTSGATTTVGGGEREVDVFLGVKSDNERGYVDDLLANTSQNVRTPSDAQRRATHRMCRCLINTRAW